MTLSFERNLQTFDHLSISREDETRSPDLRGHRARDRGPEVRPEDGGAEHRSAAAVDAVLLVAAVFAGSAT